MTPPSPLGLRIALGVGIAAMAGAVAVVALGGERVIAVILAIVGTSALSGWERARRASRAQK